MWFNASREHRLAFDDVAWSYDRTRTRFDGAILQSMVTQAGLRPGAAVFEVGAGSGQLTTGLVELGYEVTANEPGANMRAYLERLAPGRVAVRPAPFEDEVLEAESYAAVFAANSFHWIMPEVAFAKASEILVANGSLCLLWNFSFLERRVQERLNGSAFQFSEDLIQDPDVGIDVYEDVMAAGRQVIVDSGYFEAPWWGWQTIRREVPAHEYPELAVSYASTAALDAATRARLQAAIQTDLRALGANVLVITEHVYSLVARKAWTTSSPPA